jgi:hypothetical protein
LNSAFADLEKFYDVPVVPTPPLKPKAKGSVENAVKWVESQILAVLYDRTFPNFDVLNEEISHILERMNNTVKQREKESRRVLFEKVDLPQMRKLPDEQFNVCEYKRCKIPSNYHITFSDHYYSVPYELYNSSHPVYVIVKGTLDKVQICTETNLLICEHARSYDEFPAYVTQKEHMPAEHRYYEEVNKANSSFYLKWARRIGVNMERFIQGIIYNFEYEEQSYNSCNGILHLCDHVPNALADDVARYCLDNKKLAYSSFKYELAKKKKEESDRKSEKKAMEVDQSMNVRGAGYYK